MDGVIDFFPLVNDAQNEKQGFGEWWVKHLAG